jgi:hypothetical protein
VLEQVAKRLLVLVGGLVLGAVALVIREGIRGLGRSSPSDPWSPHQKGF